ncbi:hypothetical protein LIER_10942 [Lithospermum erythrorhizon]|uniref:RNase H type-1 domain-containing protein n=1 Tax=Lithospermum erythrorhizon TaxID=34254 RepID=A0AAV3PP20_LITER
MAHSYSQEDGLPDLEAVKKLASYMDDIIKKWRIPMASKCLCCTQEETIAHVFFSNPIADRIWMHFATMIDIAHHNLINVQEALITWSLSASEKGHIRQVVPVVILWALWEARNKAKHHNVKYNFHRILSRINNLLSLKLNIDAAKNNISGYGGILRDSNGKLICVIGCLGTNLNALEAELDAVLVILKWTVQLGYQNLMVEVDSLTLVNMIRNKTAYWKNYNKMTHIS